jgi:deazaflavin-dependent oxidoreductase (nitroreductase family)
MSVKVPRSGMRGTPFPRFLTAFANRLVLRQFRRGGARAGASRHPAWLHNLARQSDAVIEFDDGRRLDVRAETLEGEELETAWARIAVDAPEYVKYRSKTDRHIPVIRLRQRTPGPHARVRAASGI